MIVINPILGGIGNQLFQLTALLNLQSDAELKVDATLFSTSFGVNETILKDIPLFRHIDFHRYSSWRRTTRRLAGLTLRFSCFQEKSKVYRLLFKFLYLLTQYSFSSRYSQKVFLLCPSGTGFHSIEIPSQAQCVVMLGYFQSHRYQDWNTFSKTDLHLQSEELRMKVQFWQSLDSKTRPLIVHIRRGDYLLNAHLGVISKDYYLRNIPFVYEKSGCNAIWVFSNENSVVSDYVPKNLHDVMRIFPSTGFTDLETLEVMKLGHAYLIANSTFSWWAANLSKSRPENIYIPMPWHSKIADPAQLSPDCWKTLTTIFES